MLTYFVGAKVVKYTLHYLTRAFSEKGPTQGLSRRDGRQGCISWLNALARNGCDRAMCGRRQQGLRCGRRPDSTSRAAIALSCRILSKKSFGYRERNIRVNKTRTLVVHDSSFRQYQPNLLSVRRLGSFSTKPSLSGP